MMNVGRRNFLLGATAFLLTSPIRELRAAAETLLLTIYGQSNSTDVGGGQHRKGIYPIELPDNAVMFEGGPATYKLQPGPFVEYHQKPRERASTSLLYLAKRFDLLNGQRLLVDNPGQPGASFAALGPGKKPYERMVENHRAAAKMCAAEGSRLSLAPVFLVGGEQDMRLGTPRTDMVKLIDRIVSGLRNATSDLPGGADRAFYSWQPASHVRLFGKTRSGLDPTVSALGTADAASSIERFYLTHPGYIQTYFDGVHLDAFGHRHNGLMFAKAWHEVVVNGSWKPLEPKSAKRTGEKTVQVIFHVPAPPLRFDIERIKPLADGGFGLGIWADYGKRKCKLEGVVIDGNGASSVTLTSAEPLPDRGLVFRSAYDSDAAAPVEGSRYDHRAGPLLGARTNLCDSDSTTVDLNDSFGRSFDMRNFCLISEISVR